MLSHSELDLLTPEQTWSETTHELEIRLKQMVRYGHIEARTARGLLEEALEVIEARITLLYS